MFTNLILTFILDFHGKCQKMLIQITLAKNIKKASTITKCFAITICLNLTSGVVLFSHLCKHKNSISIIIMFFFLQHRKKYRNKLTTIIIIITTISSSSINMYIKVQHLFNFLLFCVFQKGELSIKYAFRDYIYSCDEYI